MDGIAEASLEVVTSDDAPMVSHISSADRVRLYEIRKARALIASLGPEGVVAKLVAKLPDGSDNPEYDKAMVNRLRLALRPLPGGDPVWQEYWLGETGREMSKA